MLYRIYERMLEGQISGQKVPGCIAIILSAGDLSHVGLEKVKSLTCWSERLGVTRIILYLDEDSHLIRDRIFRALAGTPARVVVHTEDEIREMGTGGNVELLISLGYGGKREVTVTIRKVLRDVEQKLVEPDQIDEKIIEENLRFRARPDLVIRAGGRQLSDFMIWQAAYSELYFTEVNWNALRKIDFLRAIRDYQRRVQRFGR